MCGCSTRTCFSALHFSVKLLTGKQLGSYKNISFHGMQDLVYANWP